MAHCFLSPRTGLGLLAGLLSSLCFAAPLEISVPRAQAPNQEGFKLGTSRNPAGSVLGVTSSHLTKDGKAWMPIMGEFHYTRYPETEWRTELLKMKAGGINIVATYVFWNHHEEIEGQFDWTGRRNLRRFLETCQEVGLFSSVRCGPWCHGEVRNGGIPDWVLARGLKVRSDDPAYLERVDRLYAAIAEQTRGLLWKDGGPVVAIQVENEYGGPGEHLLTLKRLAVSHGLDVPLYTRTGWPALKTPLPFGEILPLFGAYAEGFWDRELRSMPGSYWAAFRFTGLRTDTAIANEQLGPRSPRDEADAGLYPYLTCELGGGMMNSYHRRIRIEPEDLETVALIKIGSGGNLPGYYMYHGGTNPDGKLSTLMEAQDTPMTNWNDMPVKGYDFYAPLGEYGQVRPHYHSLRRLHLLARDFGEQLAPLPSVLPALRPTGREDTLLRWCLRSDGDTGFVFVSNHERGRRLPDQEGVQFKLTLADGAQLTLPQAPIRVPSGARFVWPVRLELAPGLKLSHATAQPLCRVSDSDGVTVFFAEQPGIPAEFAFPAGTKLTHGEGRLDTRDGLTVLSGLKPGRGVAATLPLERGELRLVLLNEADSLALWRAEWRGQERVFLSPADSLVVDQDQVKLSTWEPGKRWALVAPYKDLGGEVEVKEAGLWAPLRLPAVKAGAVPVVKIRQLREAGPARVVPLGRCVQPVAEAPRDADFEQAALWELDIPAEALGERDCLLRLDYSGDVIRVMIGDRLVTDDYSNGRPMEIGLWRHRAELAKSPLRVLILPQHPSAPIFTPAPSPEASLRAATIRHNP